MHLFSRFASFRPRAQRQRLGGSKVEPRKLSVYRTVLPGAVEGREDRELRLRRQRLELSKGERTGNGGCADNEAKQSRRIPYDDNEDHNPVPIGTCERIRNNNAPTGWRTPAAG